MIEKAVRLIRSKFFTRIDNNCTVFTSFSGKYADSPKAITETYHKLNPEKTIIWLVNDVYNKEIPEYVVKIKYGTNEAIRAYEKASVIIDNVYCDHEYYANCDKINQKIKYNIITFLKSKKGKRYYTFWHGTALKKIGSDSIKSNVTNFCCNNTTMFLDNEHMEKIQKRITNNSIKIKLLGVPRNDILFKNINISELKNRLNLPKNKKIAIYAPSFRSDNHNQEDIRRSGINQLNAINIEKLLLSFRERFGSNWVLVCRFHYKVEKQIDWKKIRKEYGNSIINGNEHDDIMEYLKCSDALITDMSSSLFDFSLTSKPVFLFFPDEDHYKNSERGLYFDTNSLPYSLSNTPEQLYKNILNFNENKYNAKLKTFFKKLGYIDNKERAYEICEYIKKEEPR